MTISRESQVSLESTSFYHCYVRCVRRAYLCGVDGVSGQNYDHRKQWLVSRIRFLSYVFSIDVCAYAVMSNHYHVVLHVDKERAQAWSMEEVVDRWLQLYNGSPLVDRWRKNPDALSQAEMDKVTEVVELWRERLYDISWFMRGINEKIARMANEEEGCKGRFWEGRFKSQALLDEGALLSCMAYVDLNPVRAAMADDLVDSDFTSVQQRLFDYSKTASVKDIAQSSRKGLHEKGAKQDKLKEDLQLTDLPSAPLMPFSGSGHTDIHRALPFTLEDYFDLIDSTGRVFRDDKSGTINPYATKLISRLGIDPDRWIDHVRHFGRSYAKCAGSSENIRQFSERFDCRWGKGIGQSNQVYKRCA